MSKPNDGGTAFPAQPDCASSGMTLRQYYAGLAMQGFIGFGVDDPETAAKYAVETADALIAELEKEEGR